jgi:hypothetical protein
MNSIRFILLPGTFPKCFRFDSRIKYGSELTNERRKTMEENQIASLTLKVDPKALRSIISSGRLLEFADTVAAQAAAQISAQLVQHVAEGSLSAKGLEAGAGAEVSYVLVTGDGEPGFGTKPRPPHWVVTSVDNVVGVGLRQMAAGASESE